MNLVERYRRLTLWNKLGVWGSIASLIGLVIAAWTLWPANQPHYRLRVEPTHHLTSIGDLTPEGYMVVGVDVVNMTKPSAELHNIEGEVWLAAQTIVEASRAPDKIIRDVSYYNFGQPLLHKSSGFEVMRWSIVPPRTDQRFTIGYKVVSSETEWAGGGWNIVNENGRPKIVDATK